MDSDYEMMMHYCMQEEGNVVVDEEEHLTILVVLLQLQADELSKSFPLVEVRDLGEIPNVAKKIA
jgi:hypothetical protein